jgi:branched-subunit amino acid permease
MQIVNLTQHKATQDQLDAGVVEPSVGIKSVVVNLLTFVGLPTTKEVVERANGLAQIMKLYDPDFTGEVGFMVGGAPYLMAALTTWAPIYNMVFAYSERVSEEVHDADGSVRKINVFKHLGFVQMPAHM